MQRSNDVIAIDYSHDVCTEISSVDGVRFYQITLLKFKPEKKPKRKVDLNVQDPKYRKPFEYGWTRELVYRTITNNNNSIDSDVYYTSPTGVKLRSMRQVSEFLESHTCDGLTEQNFTFVRKSLGVNNPQLELIRNADRTQSTRKRAEDIRKRDSVIAKVDPKPVITKPLYSIKKPVKCFRAGTDPTLYKPFYYGWVREVVYKDDSNRLVETNYITPKGLRIKTAQQVSEYLESTGCKDLTTSNFTFCKGPLGLNDPKKEIIIKPVIQKLLKPFEYGWKREVVYRLISKHQSKQSADVYYYTPIGEKLRSYTEIALYLVKIRCKVITVDNFCFTKRPLGVNDPNKESIRSALPRIMKDRGQKQQTKAKSED